MRQCVVFTANDRPHYMREALETWNGAGHFGDAHVVFLVEPGNPEMEQVCATAHGRLVAVRTNPERYGALGNPWHAFEAGFGLGYDFVILAEDDSLVAGDVLDYFLWSQIMFAGRPEVLAVCALQRPSAVPGGDHGVVVQGKFCPTVWGTWRDRWEGILRDSWDHDYSRKGWDWDITERLLPQGYRCAFPCHSRAQVSGQYGGTHLRPEDYESHLSRCFQEEYPAGRFTEVME